MMCCHLAVKVNVAIAILITVLIYPVIVISLHIKRSVRIIY